MCTVIVHTVTQAYLPTNACFFCGCPITQEGIECIDETASDRVLGMVCSSCAQHKPAQLQAVLSEKASQLRAQHALLSRQADALLLRAERLERLARGPMITPAVAELELVLHAH